MPVISKRFAEELNDKEVRHAYLDEKTRAKIALQIRTLRTLRGWSQADLGLRMGKSQGNIARLEQQDTARYTLTTLLELASAYDCGLVVEFVAYENFLIRSQDLRPETLSVPAFSPMALQPLYADAPILPPPEPMAAAGAAQNLPVCALQGLLCQTGMPDSPAALVQQVNRLVPELAGSLLNAVPNMPVNPVQMPDRAEPSRVQSTKMGAQGTETMPVFAPLYQRPEF